MEQGTYCGPLYLNNWSFVLKIFKSSKALYLFISSEEIFSDNGNLTHNINRNIEIKRTPSEQK